MYMYSFAWFRKQFLDPELGRRSTLHLGDLLVYLHLCTSVYLRLHFSSTLYSLSIPVYPLHLESSRSPKSQKHKGQSPEIKMVATEKEIPILIVSEHPVHSSTVHSQT
jgi:hypothetical protein